MLTFAECRAAVRSVKSTEFGAQALSVARPRGAFGLLRSRAPLAVRLYVAAAEQRLIWSGVDAFAMIEAPAADQIVWLQGSRWVRLLRMVDRHWDHLALAAPILTVLPLSVLLVLVWPSLWWWAVLGLVAVMAYVAIVMLIGVVASTLWLARLLTGKRRPDHDAAATLRSGWWALTLCHTVEVGSLEPLVRQVVLRLADKGASTLVCRRSGITTGAARAQLQERQRTESLFVPDSEVILMYPEPGAVDDRPWPVDRRSFVPWYVGGLMVHLAIGARIVADWERAACAPDSCQGRPADYGSAMRWLLQRLLLNDPPTVSPASHVIWLYGWLTSIAALVGWLVLVAAAYNSITYHRGLVEISRRKALRMPVVLILVATRVEFDAVLAAAARRIGHRPVPLLGEIDTVVDLGESGGAQVLLGQSAAAGSGGQQGATATAYAIIQRRRPDFVIMTGICYGLREDQQELGDVIVARRVRDLNQRKITDEREIPRGVEVETSAALVGYFQTAVGLGWRRASVHFGLLLSGEFVLDSPVARARLKQEFPHALGGEMEGTGVYSAARGGEPWILVKAVCDLGMHKTDEHQVLAAENAADLTLHVIEQSYLGRVPVR